MLSFVIKPLRNATSVLLANDSPRQVAAGIAIGMLVGLVPKGNLIAIMLVMLLCSLRVNKTAGLMSAAVFSWLGIAVDGLAHQIGSKLLSLESLQPSFAWLYDQPLGPWLAFNNTVVLGSLVLGIYLLYPCYLVSRMALNRVQAPIAAWLRRRRVARWLLGADLTSSLGGPATLGIRT